MIYKERLTWYNKCCVTDYKTENGEMTVSEKQKEGGKPYGTVLLKMASIISVLSRSREPMPLHVLAHETGLTNSTALKILDTLVMIGYVRKDSRAKGYTLGSAILQLAHNYVSNLDIIRVAMPYLNRVYAKFSETVHIGLLDSNQLIILRSLETQKPVVCHNSTTGNLRPLYCTAMGKAILSTYSQEELDNYLAAEQLVPYTAHTITNAYELRQHLQEVAQKGYAVDDNEIEQDVYCIGVAIPGWSPMAAMSISTPAYRMTAELETSMVEALLQAKRDIMIELNHTR